VVTGKAGMQVMGDWAKGEFSAANLTAGKDYGCAILSTKGGGYAIGGDIFALPKRKDAAGTKAQDQLAQTLLFLEATGNHARCAITYDPSHFVLQHLDYLSFIDIYHERIKAFHVKDAELNPTGRQGVYSGFQPWVNRAGRFRSLGDGQVDFAGIFSKLATHGFKGWAVLEWECCLKAPDVGTAEGAPFIAKHIIPVTDKAFDDFAEAGLDQALIKRSLGLS
jgi:hypothetical protein